MCHSISKSILKDFFSRTHVIYLEFHVYDNFILLCKWHGAIRYIITVRDSTSLAYSDILISDSVGLNSSVNAYNDVSVRG